MTVYYDPKTKGYRFDFRLHGRRQTSPRGFPTKREAADAEAARRRQIRRQVAGLEPLDAPVAPAIQDWAEVYVDFLERRQRVRHLASIEHVLRVVLRFWGRRPDRELEPHEAGPYHDYRLSDPITDPSLITRFEDWMIKRKIAAATRNRYRTAMSRLYAVAMLPEFRAATTVTMNPFRAVLRDRERGRTVTLSLEQLRAVLTHASPHLRLAVAIAALAPKLRLGSILALRWSDVDLETRTIVVQEHKTVGRTGRPQVAPISSQLAGILQAARSTRTTAWVVAYRGGPVKTIDTGLKAACQAAGVPYGLRTGGATFHTIRHSMASTLARLGVPEHIRKNIMGHETITTTQKYTHLVPEDERAELERLAAAVPLTDLVVGTVVGLSPRSRPSRAPVVRRHSRKSEENAL